MRQIFRLRPTSHTTSSRRSRTARFAMCRRSPADSGNGSSISMNGGTMEFHDVVMKRRAVRRFEEDGVEREVLERIARLAQRTPSAGFSQGQRLLVVTEPDQ